jgi:hypothetical protein
VPAQSAIGRSPEQREEDDGTVAKKAQKRSATKKASNTPRKAARRPADKAATKVPPVTAGARRVIVRPAPAPAGPNLGERARRLRDEIARSKHTHPDPWTYAAKARAWGDRVEILVEQIIIRGDTVATRRSLEALDAELQRDRDFQDARRLF